MDFLKTFFSVSTVYEVFNVCGSKLVLVNSTILESLHRLVISGFGPRFGKSLKLVTYDININFVKISGLFTHLLSFFCEMRNRRPGTCQLNNHVVYYSVISYCYCF